jgi:hypothetical protein
MKNLHSAQYIDTTAQRLRTAGCERDFLSKAIVVSIIMMEN